MEYGASVQLFVFASANTKNNSYRKLNTGVYRNLNLLEKFEYVGDVYPGPEMVYLVSDMVLPLCEIVCPMDEMV